MKFDQNRFNLPLNQRFNRRRFIRYGSLAAGTGILSACSQKSPSASSADTGSETTSSAPAKAELDAVTIGTSWFAEAEHGGFYQAVATGIYKDHGLDVTVRMGGPQVNGSQLLMAGTTDFNMGYAVDALQAVASDIPKVTVAAIFQKDPQALIAHPDVGVKSFEDLKGKKILLATSAQTTFWPFLKAKYGYTDDQAGVYTFNVGPFIADKELAQQCYITAEPFAVKKEGGFEPVVLLMSDHGYANYGETIETRRELLESNPDLVKRFVEASIKGWYSYLKDPAPGNELIKKDNPEMTDDQLAFGVAKMQEYGIIMSGDAEAKGIGAMTLEHWKDLYTSMAKLGVYPESMPYEKAFVLDFVNKGPEGYS